MHPGIHMYSSAVSCPEVFVDPQAAVVGVPILQDWQDELRRADCKEFRSHSVNGPSGTLICIAMEHHHV